MHAIKRLGYGAGVVLIVAVAASIPSPGTEEPTATPQPVASASATAAVSATPHPLQAVDGVQGVGLVSEQWGTYYAEVSAARVDQAMAAALLAASPEGLDEYLFIVDDGVRAVSWLWKAGAWTETQLSVTAVGTMTLAVSGPRPGNCATAVALGLTAAEAARWAHLDRDRDGVACYGD